MTERPLLPPTLVRAAVLALGLALAACTTTPTAPPALDLPAGNAAANDVALDRWWTTFNDATLTGYIDEALAHNLDLAAAMARIETARAAGQARVRRPLSQRQPRRGRVAYALDRSRHQSAAAGLLVEIDGLPRRARTRRTRSTCGASTAPRRRPRARTCSPRGSRARPCRRSSRPMSRARTSSSSPPTHSFGCSRTRSRRATTPCDLQQRPLPGRRDRRIRPRAIRGRARRRGFRHRDDTQRCGPARVGAGRAARASAARGLRSAARARRDGRAPRRRAVDSVRPALQHARAPARHPSGRATARRREPAHRPRARRLFPVGLAHGCARHGIGRAQEPLHGSGR